MSKEIEEIVNSTIVCFDLRLGDYIEIGGWVNNSSAYQIVSFNDLPCAVHEAYGQAFLGAPCFQERYFCHEVKPNNSAVSLFDQLEASLEQA